MHTLYYTPSHPTQMIVCSKDNCPFIEKGMKNNFVMISDFGNLRRFDNEDEQGSPKGAIKADDLYMHFTYSLVSKNVVSEASLK